MHQPEATLEPQLRPPRVRAARREPIYVAAALLMLIGAVGGFWPQYYSVPFGGRLEPRFGYWLYHLHGALFLGWLVMFLGQALLAREGRTALHRRLGPWLAAWGYLAAAVGTYAALDLAARSVPVHRTLDQAASFVAFPLIDMAFLAGFLTAGVLLRRRPEAHKRLMLLAAFAVAVVGSDRWVSRTALIEAGIHWWQPLVLMPLLAAVGWDLVRRRGLHPAWVVGLACHLFRLNMAPLTESEGWLRIGRALLSLQL